MSEIDRLGVDIEPLSSFDGVQMSAMEFDAFKTIADPAGAIDTLVKEDWYEAMNDRQRKVALDLVVEHHQAQAETAVRKADFFSDLRHKVRRKDATVMQPPEESIDDEVADQ